MDGCVSWNTLPSLSDQLHSLDISSRTLPWVIATTDSDRPRYRNHLPISSGAPVLASVSKGVPGIFMDCHMMVSEPEKVWYMPPSPGACNS